ncbi:hypothetical protein [Luteimonas fraxinea]|uniref:hypothetical protein n=1 Tax=Luteimonas fraxinea TaxID=2901869 RepID=UPI001E63BD8B|nr:hypothetical protein [Luteimonas fraxinea]MCD9126020.1 hypothetical protein [Luteimonas fraxinea]
MEAFDLDEYQSESETHAEKRLHQYLLARHPNRLKVKGIDTPTKYAQLRSGISGDLGDFADLSVCRSIWINAYSSTPSDHTDEIASEAADDALSTYLARRFNLMEIPKGMNAEAFMNFCYQANPAYFQT